MRQISPARALRKEQGKMKKSSFIILTSVLCAVSSVFTAVCVFFITRAFMPTPALENKSNTVAVSGDGEEFINGGVYNMPQTLSFSGNVMPLADTSATSTTNGEVTLTATVTPENAEVTLSWSVAFKNPSSAWANGKSAANYVSVQPVAGTLSAKVTCLSAFGEQIIITAESTKDSTKKATCTCDYAKRAISANIVLNDSMLYNNFTLTEEGFTTAKTVYSTGALYESLSNLSYGVGTVNKSAYSVCGIKLKVEQAFINYIELLFAGKSVPSVIDSVNAGTYTVYTQQGSGSAPAAYAYFSSLYSLFKVINGSVPSDDSVRRIGIAINDDLKSSGSTPTAINGLKFVLTFSDDRGNYNIEMPVKFVYNADLPTNNLQKIDLSQTTLTF